MHFQFNTTEAYAFNSFAFSFIESTVRQMNFQFFSPNNECVSCCFLFFISGPGNVVSLKNRTRSLAKIRARSPFVCTIHTKLCAKRASVYALQRNYTPYFCPIEFTMACITFK